MWTNIYIYIYIYIYACVCVCVLTQPLCMTRMQHKAIFGSWQQQSTKMQGRALLVSLDCFTLPLIRTLYCRVLNNEVSSTIFIQLWRWTKPSSDDRRKIISPQSSTTTSTQKRPRAASPFVSWKKQRITVTTKDFAEPAASSTWKRWKSASHL